MSFLKKLFGKKAAEETAEVPPEFLQENPPEWVIILNGREVATGVTFSIRAPLFQADRHGTAEIANMPGKGGPPQTATAKFSRPEIDRLFLILGFSFPAEITSVAGATDEGLPVSVAIYRESPFFLRTADCNLAGWLDSRQPAPPVVEIGRILMEARHRALPQ